MTCCQVTSSDELVPVLSTYMTLTLSESLTQVDQCAVHCVLWLASHVGYTVTSHMGYTETNHMGYTVTETSHMG